MFLRLSTSALAFTVMTAPAAFSLTAEEVWQTWEGYLDAAGYTVDVGSRDGDGTALTLKDVQFTQSAEGADTVIRLTVPTIAMSQTGGADVRTELPEPIAVKITAADGDDDSVTIDATIDASNSETIVTEENGGQRVTTTAPSVGITVDQVTGEDVSADINTFDIQLVDVKSSTLRSGAEGLNTAMEHSVGRINLNLDVVDATDGTVIKGQGALEGLVTAGMSEFPDGHTTKTNTALSDALRAGASTVGKASFGPLHFDLNGQPGAENPQDGPIEFAMNFDSGSVDFSLAEGRITYQADLDNVGYKIVEESTPFPINVSMAAISANFQFPLLQADDAQPFKLAYSLDELRLNDEVWDLLDNSGDVSRDPANLDLDVTGDVLVREDLLKLFDDPDAAEDMPVSPVNITLNQLALSALGLDAKAEGKMRFPNPENIEVMDGDLTVRYQGINDLMGNLVKAGLISQDDASGASMMMMMFAKPVDGAVDTMETKVEAREDGSLFVNGVQMR